MSYNLHWQIHSLESIRYADALKKQQLLFEEMLQQKNNPDRNLVGHLLFCEHPPVFTLGKNGKTNHLLIDAQTLANENIEYFPADRGGDITYHGYGQLVLYPILDLDLLKIGLRQYVHTLEQAVIQTLQLLNLPAQRLEKAAGVWLNPNEKICALGIKASRNVTMHGLALNVYTSLKHFDYIVACGLEGKKTTSILEKTGKKYPLTIIADMLLLQLEQLLLNDLPQ